MKKVFALWISLILIFASFTGISAVGAPESTGNSSPGEFAVKLSQMLQRYEEDNYFVSMSVTLGESTINIDGADVPMDSDGTTAYAENGRIMMPVRAVAEAMGADVSYDSKDQSVKVETEETMVIMTIGEDIMEVNGEKMDLVTAPEVVNSRTMLPVRDMAEALDCEVEWLPESQTAVFTRPLQTKRIIAFEEGVECTNSLMTISGDGITVLQFETVEDARDALEELTKRGIKAEPDSIRKTDSMSWGISRIGAEDYNEQTSYASTADVVVAVVDSGVDLSHRLFEGRLVKGYDIYDGDSNPQDMRGHGTHVAGTVIDVAGSNRDIAVMPVKVFGTGEYTSGLAVAQGVRYAADNGADVINLSLGGWGESRVEIDAVNYAYNKNIAVVVSAGNEAKDISQSFYTPGSIENAITVSAMTENGDSAYFTNYGSGIIDFTAPGVNISSAGLGGGQTVKHGTSMAAPHVSGVYALAKSIHPDADLDNITRALKSNAIKTGSSKYAGSGCICIDEFEKVMSSVDITAVSASGISEEKGKISGTIEYDGIEPRYAGVRLGTSAGNMKEVYKVPFSENRNGSMRLVYTPDGLENGTRYYATVFVVSAAGDEESSLVSFETDYTEPEPEPEPEPQPAPPASELRILPDRVPSGTLKKGETFGLSGRIKSNYHITDVRSCIINSNGKTVMEASGWTTTRTYVIEGSALDKGMKFDSLSEGTYRLRYTAEDESGNRITWTSDAFSVEGKGSVSSLRILPDKYPSGTIPKDKSFGLSGRIKSDCHITDVRSYLLDSNGNIVMEASGWTTTRTYVIEGSALDKGMKFNKLGTGGYYLRYSAADESGNRVTWTSDIFYVK